MNLKYYLFIIFPLFSCAFISCNHKKIIDVDESVLKLDTRSVLNEKEKDSIQKLITNVSELNCSEISNGLSKKDDYFIILNDSENSKKYCFKNYNNQIPIANLRKYLLKVYNYSKTRNVFESSNELVLPPPPPLQEISLDSVKFFKNDK